MTNWDSIHKKELLVLSLAFAMPLLVMGMILINESKTSENKLVKLEDTKTETDYIFSPNIKAKSAMVTELNTGKILYSKSENDQLPIASLTKLMTTLVAVEKFEEQGVTRIQINDEHLKAFGESGLVSGQVWNVKDLIDFTLISSSNDGAKALALSAFGMKESDFVSEMNSLARKLGLSNTFFANETGLDVNFDTQAGAVSSATDLTKILRYITLHKLDTFGSTSKSHEIINVNGSIYDVENTNKSIEKLPGALLSKTGYTDIAGGNLAVVLDFGLNNPISIVILGSTLEEREDDILELFNETSTYYSDKLKKS